MKKNVYCKPLVEVTHGLLIVVFPNTYLVTKIQKDSPHKVKLHDNYKYLINMVGEASYKFDSKDESCIVEEPPLHISTIRTWIHSFFC